MNIKAFNDLNPDDARKMLTHCCGSKKWVEQLLSWRPYQSKDLLITAAERYWFALKREDWLEAFAHHPKIGDLKSLKDKFASTAHLAAAEQQSVTQATEQQLQELQTLNQLYERRFGFIFIVCATGKSVMEMLALLKKRFENDPATELHNATYEQAQIIRLRLEKIL